VRRALTALALTTGVALVMMIGPVTIALGGGFEDGCPSGLTEGTGATVEMVGACFTPSILRVQPGAQVTFENLDLGTHNVSAKGWGHPTDLAPGERFSASFPEEGTYPFACSYHAGMTGAVVVGDGSGSSWLGPGIVGLLAGCAIGALGMGLTRVRRATTEA